MRHDVTALTQVFAGVEHLETGNHFTMYFLFVLCYRAKKRQIFAKQWNVLTGQINHICSGQITYWRSD